MVNSQTWPIETTLPQQNPRFVCRTFAAIAKRYDIANHLLSGGLDFLWRAKAARIVAGEDPLRILDLATGSGDLARALRKASPRAAVIGADFCMPMLEVARKKNLPLLVQADGLRLPFREGIFDALTVAFGLRNMASWDGALREMARALRAGGLLLVMDFSLPEFAPLRKYLPPLSAHGAASLRGCDHRKQGGLRISRQLDRILSARRANARTHRGQRIFRLPRASALLRSRQRSTRLDGKPINRHPGRSVARPNGAHGTNARAACEDSAK